MESLPKDLKSSLPSIEELEEKHKNKSIDITNYTN